MHKIWTAYDFIAKMTSILEKALRQNVIFGGQWLYDGTVSKTKRHVHGKPPFSASFVVISKKKGLQFRKPLFSATSEHQIKNIRTIVVNC